MTPIFAVKLDFSIQPIGIGIQKIDGFVLKTYGMIIVRF